MARIVIVAGSVGTFLLPTAEVARRLKQIGHEVTVVSSPEFESFASGVGVRFIGTPSARRFDPLEPQPDSSWWQRLRATPSRRRAVVDGLHDDEAARIVAQLSPDLVLVEIELVSQLLAMRARDLPLAALTVFPHPFDDHRVPALHTTALPGQGWRGTELGIRARWARYRLGLRVDLLRQVVRTPGDHRRRQFRALATRLGVDTRELDFEQWVQPLMLGSVPVVSMTPPDFDFPHDPRPELFDVGAMLLEARADDDDRATDLNFVEAGKKAGRRLIYASFGAYDHGDHSDLIERVAASVEEHPEWDLVVGLGGRSDPAAFDGLPANVHVMEWAPQRKILDAADAAVVHGGYSTVHECIQARVPMLLYPIGIDHPGNSARAAYHGLGILGDREQDTPDVIASYLDRLISDDTFHAAVTEMAARTAPDDAQLAGAIDALLGREKPAHDVG